MLFVEKIVTMVDCVFLVKNGVMIKGLNSLYELREEKSFELSAVELNKVCSYCNLHLQEF